MGVKLTGKLPELGKCKGLLFWEMLRRHDVKGGVGKILEYYGGRIKNLSAMEPSVHLQYGCDWGYTTSSPAMMKQRF